MKRTPLKSYKTLQSKTPLKRTEFKRKAKKLTKEEKEAYKIVNERARISEDYFQCEGCGKTIQKGLEERHHIVFRSAGGKTVPENIKIYCSACHGKDHGINVIE